MAVSYDNIYLYSFNNYINRYVTKFDTLAEYNSWKKLSYTDIQFNPSDGVDTSLVVNIVVGVDDHNYDVSDYLIVTDASNNIKSRWFIMDSKWNRTGQFIMKLHRDVCADSYDAIMDATCFIKKAELDYDDPFIFNPENMTFNQIKTSETLLKDATHVPWLVGYVASNAELHTLDDSTLRHFYVDDLTDLEKNLPWLYNIIMGNGDKVHSDWTEYQYNVYVNEYDSAHDPDPHAYKYSFNAEGGRSPSFDVGGWQTLSSGLGVFGADYGDPPIDYNLDKSIYKQTSNTPKTLASSGFLEASIIERLEQQKELWKQEQWGVETKQTLYDTILGLEGQTIAIHYHYRKEDPVEEHIDYYTMGAGVTSRRATTYMQVDNVLPINTPSWNIVYVLEEALRAHFTNVSGFVGTDKNLTVSMSYEYNTIVGSATMVNADSIIKPSKRRRQTNYDIICAPYGALTFYVGTQIRVGGTASLETFSRLCRLNSDAIYDVQLLPYCPLQEYIDNEGVLRLPASGCEIAIPVAYDLMPLYNVYKERTTFNIPLTIAPSTDPYTKKEKVLCDFYRLCSPNYNGVFEFNAEKNGGVTNINVDMFLKPYNPFIHLNPDFGELYGDDYNDNRGLICGGDFSITRTEDKFATYELQNKNYRDMFNREIENMETNREYERTAQIVGTITNAIGGAASGAIGGSKLGSSKAWPIVGGILGAGAAVAGGIADYNASEGIFNESVDYKKDMFGMQLDNIKALPNSLVGVSVFNNITKSFPFLEYYTCTDEEKQALEDKLKWNGMTVGRIGTFGDYVKEYRTYIQAQLIHMSDKGDAHMQNVIADELLKGVYIV